MTLTTVLFWGGLVIVDGSTSKKEYLSGQLD